MIPLHSIVGLLLGCVGCLVVGASWALHRFADAWLLRRPLPPHLK